jgi:hypothetical protein
MLIRVHGRSTMIGAPQRFPAFEDWTNMTEPEQDALLARMEAARRRRLWSLWAAAVVGAATTAFIAFAIWL